MNAVLESFTNLLLDRTTILWDYSEIAMTAVFSMILSCGSHSKVRSRHLIQVILTLLPRLEEQCVICLGY